MRSIFKHKEFPVSLQKKLRKITDKINNCKNIENLDKCVTDLSLLKNDIEKINKKNKRDSYNNQYKDIESNISNKRKKLNNIRDARQLHMIAFMREFNAIESELSQLKPLRDSSIEKKLSPVQQNYLNAVKDKIDATLVKNVNSALSNLKGCADKYLANELDLTGFKTSASSLIVPLKIQITRLVVNPSVKLKALEITIKNAPKDPVRQEKLALFRAQISAMRMKAAKLKKEGHNIASEAATLLCKELTDIACKYEENKTDLSTFKSFSKEKITKAHEVLDDHRGAKRVLHNFVLILATFGIGYVIGALYKRSFFALNPKTDSAIQLNDMEENINQMKALKS